MNNKRCTNCGKFPFCSYIVESSKDNQCSLWIKRKVDNYETSENFNKGCEQSTRESNK